MYETLNVTVRDGVQIIQFNRPDKLNAINEKMYLEIPQALKRGAEQEDVVVTVFTGAGDYYSSGNDITGYMTADFSDMSGFIETACQRLEGCTRAFLDYPKILVAVVNGPAIGFAVTTLALFDLVYASEKATFQTPFTQLGLVPEGCSSYTFPKIMGRSRAVQMLQFNRKVNANEAFEWGLVAEVYPHGKLDGAWEKIYSIAQLPSKSLIYAKRLMRSQERAPLYKAMILEIERLRERWQSEDNMNAIMKFMNRRKSKL